MTPLIWLAFVAAAILEVGGDALIRKGLRGSGWAAIAAGCVVLACYGLMVNTVKWDFSNSRGLRCRFCRGQCFLRSAGLQGDGADLNVAGTGDHRCWRARDPVWSSVGWGR